MNDIIPSVWAFSRLSVVAVLLCNTAFVVAQTDEDDETPAGLVATYQSISNRAEVSRIDRTLSFHWKDDSPDQRIPAGPFKAKWAGQLLIRQADRYSFHAFTSGRITIRVDGKTVLQAESLGTGWSAGSPLNLPVGERKFTVEFETAGSTDSRMSVFWSSDTFELEPLPGYLLFRDESDAQLSLIERGQQLFIEHRCGRCHQRPNELPTSPGPDLTRMNLDAGWLTNWLQHSRVGQFSESIAKQPSHTTTHYGLLSADNSADEAADIVAFLLQQSKPTKLSKVSKPKEAKQGFPDGKLLLHSVGCLACHSFNGRGNSSAGARDLSLTGDKRSKEWIAAWLKDPKSLNRDHQMPVFHLSNDERARLAVLLAESNTPQVRTGIPHGDSDSGRKLVEQSGCINCHRINGLDQAPTDIRGLSSGPLNWDSSCSANFTFRGVNQPAYALGADQVHALRAYVESRQGELSKLSDFEHGRMLLTQKGCIACHDRDHDRGISAIAAKITRADDRLRGQSQGLIPPALTAVGDKLLDSALAQAVSGEQKNVRLPWLSVRMPRFEHSKQDKQAMVHFLIDHDRIPDGAPGGSPLPEIAADERLVTGNTLVGPRGFSCVACHTVGSYTPKRVALGTRGSDLMMIGQRMRPQFFTRWTRSPIRIVAGMEMPSFTKPVANILGGDIHKQLGVTWDALNDPKFTPPSNPSVVEQFWTIEAEQPARIVRDVFTHVTDGTTGYVARSFAIGFNNEHSLMIDLDTLAVRDWRFGDFATQRTEGKSWYWDMSGIPLAKGFSHQSDFALETSAGELQSPKERDGVSARLKSYERSGDGVILRYVVFFQRGDELIDVDITEILTPVTGDRHGVQREFSVAGSHTVHLVRPDLQTQLGNAKLVSDQQWHERRVDGRPVKTIQLGKKTDLRSIQYLANVDRPRTSIKPRPIAIPEGGEVTTVPGFEGRRLPITPSIMPTALTWTSDGTLAFTSLKGDVFLAKDTDGDGLEDSLTLFEEGLAAPFGIIADGPDLIVAHKPEVLRLSDTDGDGRADKRTVVATGWGYTDNYHDWTTGIIRDSSGNMYVGISSDYAQKSRPKNKGKWRGDVLRITPQGEVYPVGHSFRYPIGLAIDNRDRIFVSDNQGVQNTFNEINLLQDDGYYGVPGRHETNPDAPTTKPAIQVPHPWSRSVNGLAILKNSGVGKEVLGHGIGCEYDYHFLVRFTCQTVADTVQGAAYYFSQPNQPSGGHNFVGPINVAVSPDGDIYIASIYDSGWLGGLNTGAITRLRRDGAFPLGIRELRAIEDGFELEFTGPIDKTTARDSTGYSISGYTRKWSGAYASDDSERYRVNIKSIDVSSDRKTVQLHVDKLKEGFVYEVTCGRLNPIDKEKPLWPTTGHYTMHRIPTAK